MSSGAEYVLGSDEAEVARLDAQAAHYAAATALLLRSAGITSGMRVLDLGTGLGHVAQLLAELVGSNGEVVGIDGNEMLLRVAEARRIAAGLDNVQLLKSDVRDFRDPVPFDAVAGRLILFHLPDAAQVIRHHTATIVPGGRFVAIDFDAGAARAEPPVPLVDAALDFIRSAFRRAGANPTVGARLAVLLGEAGLTDVESFGIQTYLAPGDPRGPAILGGVVRALSSDGGLPALLEPESLEQRLAAELQSANAVLLPPALVGAWGRRPARVDYG